MIAIVIPAYNEEKTISWVAEESKRFGKVIVVDDCSRDDTAMLAKKAGALVIRHERNQGLGSSLRTGFRKVLAMKADIIITIDGDGQHSPRDVPRFISAINNGHDFVLGERDLRKYPLAKKFGNFFLNMATNFISGTNLKDTESGFRAFRRNALKKLYLKARKYEIAVEIVFEAGRNDLKTKNIPIKSPIYVKGVGVVDGFRNFFFLFRRRERTWRSYIEDFRYVLKKRL
jgi:glycosyltransferase involved in cell wall biosynthesis